MILGSVPKQPNETFPIFVDFVRRLATGETLSSKTVTSEKLSDGTDSTATLLLDLAIDGTKVLVRLKKAGADGEDHRVTFHAVTNLTNEVEDEIDVNVREY